MKTAMQEFLDLIKTLNKGLWAELHDDDIIDKALEKEKEQIENAYWDGGQDVPTNGDRCQEYYNQIYNQNK